MIAIALDTLVPGVGAEDRIQRSESQWMMIGTAILW